LISQYKYSLGICDTVRYGYRDVDSTFLPKYLSEYVDTAKSSNADSIVNNEITNKKSEKLIQTLLNEISINNGSGYSINKTGMKQALTGYILSRIYDTDLSKMYSKPGYYSFPQTQQDIEVKYFKSGKFERDANFFFSQLRTYLYSCITIRQEKEKSRNNQIISNRKFLTGICDSQMTIFLRKYPQYTKNEIAPMYENAIEISAFKVNRQASIDELTTSWTWNLIDYLNSHKKSKKFAEAMLENSVVIGMSYEDVYAVHGIYLEQSTKQYSGNGVEIYVTPNEQNTVRIYSFKNNKLISLVDEE